MVDDRVITSTHMSGFVVDCFIVIFGTRGKFGGSILFACQDRRTFPAAFAALAVTSLVHST